MVFGKDSVTFNFYANVTNPQTGQNAILYTQTVNVSYDSTASFATNVTNYTNAFIALYNGNATATGVTDPGFLVGGSGTFVTTDDTVVNLLNKSHNAGGATGYPHLNTPDDDNAPGADTTANQQTRSEVNAQNQQFIKTSDRTVWQ